MANNPSVNMTFTAFITALNENNEYNVLTDIMNHGYQEALVNWKTQTAPFCITGLTEIQNADNVLMEWQDFSGITEWDDTLAFSSPTLNRVFVNLSKDYLVETPQISYRDERSAQDWAKFISEQYQRGYIRMRDFCFYVATNELVKQVIASDLSWVNFISNGATLNLQNPANTSQQMYQVAYSLALKTNNIINRRSKINNGVNRENMRWVLGANTYLSMTKSVAGFSGSNLAYEKTETGLIPLLFGNRLFEDTRFGRSEPTAFTTQGGRGTQFTFDLTNFEGVICYQDSLYAPIKHYREVPYPINRGNYGMNIGFRFEAIVYPTKRELVLPICNEAPSITDINAWRADLAVRQPNLYGKLVSPITQDEYDAAVKANAVDVGTTIK